jgi:hypothetical protein
VRRVAAALVLAAGIVLAVGVGGLGDALGVTLLLLTAGGVLAFVTAPHAVEARERVPAQTAPLAAPADPKTGGDAA